MVNRNKRLTAILLIIAVVFSLMSVGIYAQETVVVTADSSQNQWPEIAWPEVELPEITVPEIVGPVEVIQIVQPLRPEGPVKPEETEAVELPQEEVPSAENPEEIPAEVDIREEEVPLAAVPQTGDNGLLYTMMAVLSGMGLVGICRKKN